MSSSQHLAQVWAQRRCPEILWINGWMGGWVGGWVDKGSVWYPHVNRTLGRDRAQVCPHLYSIQAPTQQAESGSWPGRLPHWLSAE